MLVYLTGSVMMIINAVAKIYKKLTCEINLRKIT